ncbi:MAG: hypothetical protein Q8K32_09485 [Archangium sp.]|nr:hypothetical protein [Archangium sp.]
MRWFIAVLAVVSAAPAWSADPLKTDPDKYKLVEENARVRVLRFHDKPGDKSTQHTHPEFVLYALSPFKRRLIFPDGKTMEREFKAGELVLMPAQTHVGENIGTTDTEVLLVELKEPARK